MILVRQEIGDVLRDFRLQKGRTLRQVASKASVALGYLSEVERGQKEASSEILASVAEALDVPISTIMREVGDRISVLEGLSPFPDVVPDDLVAEGEPELLGLDAVGLVTRGTTASGYMPDAAPIAIKVVAERGTRRLLGVQVVGGQGAAKRVDAAAAVLHYGGTVDDLAWMDLSYAPPFATAWEILQIAARRVAERL